MAGRRSATAAAKGPVGVGVARRTATAAAGRPRSARLAAGSAPGASARGDAAVGTAVRLPFGNWATLPGVRANHVTMATRPTAASEPHASGT
ncbi:MAG: hypothetical protein IPG72_14930 [Ardenticatenales bacterium]|nr:hypothetical protein [Ardenticatenales bacterium]